MSNMLLPTLRNISSDVEIDSHRLMLKAGLIRQMSTGIYNYLPFGLKALRNVEKIVREEMNRSGGQEILASALIPSELWYESGRYNAYGPELMRLKDRNNHEFCLGPTHEEVFTMLARQEIKSYKQLPLNLYQIQTKYRDEVRPRYGMMRSREFLMKDAYSFDKDEEGLDKSFITMKETYYRIFKRCGLDSVGVEADSGSIGGNNSMEFIIESKVGEDDIAFCSHCGYAANVEKATSYIYSTEQDVLKEIEKVFTPNIHTIEQVCKFIQVPIQQTVKTLIYKADHQLIGVMVRGDKEVNELKVKNTLNCQEDVILANDEEVEKCTGAMVGFAGPIHLKVDKLLVDEEVVTLKNMIVGANESHYHLKNVNYGRDFSGVIGDFRLVQDGDLCPHCLQPMHLSKGTEVGHIFKLGTKYSKVMNAVFLDENGKTKPFVMGCYGIGISRLLASIIEQHHDENGIIWPESIAPYKVIILIMNMKDELQVNAGKDLYDYLQDLNIDVLLDDRHERAGVKFNDADLLGIPYRITIGKGIKEGQVEFKKRYDKKCMEVDIEDLKHYLNIYSQQTENI